MMELLEKDFLLPLNMVRKQKFLAFLIIRDFFAVLIDNLCDNALDLVNGQLIAEYNLPDGTYCQWLISAQDNNGYVTLEFNFLNVRKH